MPTQGSPPQEYARLVLICVILFFLYTSPDQGAQVGFPGSPRDFAAERITRSRNSLDVLNTTKWQDFAPKAANSSIAGLPARYLNLTGFREADGYSWDRLDAFKQRSQLFIDEARVGRTLGSDTDSKAAGVLQGETYQNVTGIVRGEWVRYTKDLVKEEHHGPLNLTEIAPDIDWAYDDVDNWSRNVTGKSGKMSLRIDEKAVDELEKVKDGSDINAAGLIREVAATLTIQDESSNGDGYEMKLHGVHWPRQGTLLMTTTSDKFAGIFGLPHLALSKINYDTSQRILNRTLERVVEKMERAVWFDPSNPWTSTPDTQGDGVMPVPHCEYVAYVQVMPVELESSLAVDPTQLIQDIEQELRFPNGAPLSNIPKLRVSTVVFSPDCGFMLESKGPPDFSPKLFNHLVGNKQEVWLYTVRTSLLLMASVYFGQIMLLKIQSKEASTPSTIGRVSLYTVAMMVMVDALLFSSMSLLSSTAPNIFPAALVTSFAAFMSMALGVRFLGAIYNVQEPERRERLRAELAAQSSRLPPPPSLAPTRPSMPTTTITAAGAETLIPTSTPQLPPSDLHQSTASPPVIISSDQDIDAEMAENLTMASTVQVPAANAPLLPTNNRPTPDPATASVSNFGALYVKFVLLLTFFLFLSLSSMSWPVGLRTAYVHLLSMTYLSCWVPQIRRNVIRNCRKALLWKFVIGQSVLRLLPFAYFYLQEDNILFAESDWTAFGVYVGWVWIQIWVLVGQEILGPRWGLPKGWTEEGWDYHPILREDNVESGGLPIGLMQMPGSPTLERVRTGEEKRTDSGTRSVDCAICMQVLEVPVIASGTEVGGSNTAGGVVGMLTRRQYMGKQYLLTSRTSSYNTSDSWHSKLLS